jgi:hypothetical protein
LKLLKHAATPLLAFLGPPQSFIQVMAVLGPFVIFASIVLVIFMLGFHNFLPNEENGCKMTSMFEYPQFVVSFGNLYKLISRADSLHGLISEVKLVHNVMLSVCEVT